MIKILVKYRFWFLLLVISLTILASLKITSITINTDFSQFLPDNDPEYTFYKEIKSEIQDDEFLLVLGIENKETVFNKKFIEKVKSLTDSLNSIEEINDVKNLTNLSYPTNSFFGIVNIPYLEIKDSVDIGKYKKKIMQDFEITQNFVNKEGTILLIWIELKPHLEKHQNQIILKRIDQIRGEFPKMKTFLWGRKYLEITLDDIMSHEVNRFILWVLLFLLISLSLIFRKPRAIISSILLVAISFIIFTGGMVYLNRPFEIMSNLFPTIILVVGISDIIHLSIKYNIELDRGIKPKEALYNTIKQVGLAIFITSFTTAVGFYILYVSPMKVLRDFGLEAGSAVILTFVITLLLAPIFFYGKTNKNQFVLNRIFENYSDKLFDKIKLLQNYSTTVIITYGILILIAFVGIFFINTNNRQFSIPDQSKLKADYFFFEEQLGGSRSFEVVLKAKEGFALNDTKTLESLNKIHNYLDSLPYLHAVKSPILYYRTMHRAFRPTSYDSMNLVLDKQAILKYGNYFNRISKTNYLFNKKQTIYKFNARMKDFGRHEVEIINDEIITHINTLIDSAKTKAKISGMDVLFDRAHQQRINNMFLGLLIAVIVVCITLGLIFKNFALTVLALILNIVPIIISAGIMGFTNLELRSGTSIIFTIGFVIAVDNTIHLLSKFQLERKKGLSVEIALNHAIQECGKAILATSIILFGGFFVLMFSEFLEIYTLGLLMIMVVFIALTADLILAPILILKWFKKYL